VIGCGAFANQGRGVVLGNAGKSGSGSSAAGSCDKCATVSSRATEFLERIRGDGQMGFRSENPRVGGSIPPLGIAFKDLAFPASTLSPPNPAESTGLPPANAR